MALDLGERRIGVAVSDPTRTLARPLVTITRTSRKQDIAAIGALVEEYAIARIVVGLPLSLDGSEGPQARSVRRYAGFLSDSLSVPIGFCDERFSTVEASDIMRARPKRSKRSAGDEIDAMAAAVILQAYLDLEAAQNRDVLVQG
jgi:putative Holliday junction resolvase